MNFDDEDDEPGFFRRYGILLCVAAVVVTGIIVVARQMSSGQHAAPRRMEEISMVKLLPEPPPPPPPPPPPIQEQKMIEQTPVNENEPKPDDKPSPPTPSLGTGIKGNGPADSFGLTGSGGSGYVGGRNSGSGSRFGWFAAGVQLAIRNALDKNNRTRYASFSTDVRIWADSTGRITKVHLKPSTGDAAVDDAIKNALVGSMLTDGPPAGLPMPIVMHITELRPN